MKKLSNEAGCPSTRAKRLAIDNCHRKLVVELRLKSNVEDITHIISSCPMMSSRYYLPMRHDPVAKAVFMSHLKKHVGEGVPFPNEHEFIEKHGDYEYW